MENLKEFKKLIERYETITIEEIENTISTIGSLYDSEVLEKLTGFGCTDTCILCKAVGFNDDTPACNDCVYGSLFGCMYNEGRLTYDAILDADTSEALLTAYRNRAKFMKEFLTKKLNENGMGNNI